MLRFDWEHFDVCGDVDAAQQTPRVLRVHGYAGRVGSGDADHRRLLPLDHRILIHASEALQNPYIRVSGNLRCQMNVSKTNCKGYNYTK